LSQALKPRACNSSSSSRHSSTSMVQCLQGKPHYCIWQAALVLQRAACKISCNASSCTIHVRNNDHTSNASTA
jgi:hypothetical protein